MKDWQIEALAHSEGTPLYVYDLGALRETISEIQNCWTSGATQLLFATMANDRPEIIRCMCSAGVGACVNSMQHLRLALDCGIPRERIQFTSSGITLDDMNTLKRMGIAVNLDSRSQYETWCGLKGSAQVGLRVNVASLMAMPPDDGDRLGLDTAEIHNILCATTESSRQIYGLHLYAGTNYQSAEKMLPVVKSFLSFAGQFPALSYVNIGGGVGVDYSRTGLKFDFRLWSREIENDLRRLIGVRLYFEPGRALVASCCVFASRVTDVKQLRGKTYISVDGSVAIFPRPFHHPESPHHVRVLRPESSDMRTVTIVGRTTFSRDILSTCLLPGKIGVGDLLLFEDAGAYCETMMSKFLGQEMPRVSFHVDGQPVLTIAEREESPQVNA